MQKLTTGAIAPDFTLPAQDGRTVSLQEWRGRKVLLFFYPKALTPGCTKQACSVNDAREELAVLGVVPLGISPDPPELQQKFAVKHSLAFPLLSDPDHKVAEAYGVWGEKSMYGRKYEGINRSAFLIDENGRILQAWYKISPEDTVPEVKKALTAGRQ